MYKQLYTAPQYLKKEKESSGLVKISTRQHFNSEYEFYHKHTPIFNNQYRIAGW